MYQIVVVENKVECAIYFSLCEWLLGSASTLQEVYLLTTQQPAELKTAAILP